MTLSTVPVVGVPDEHHWPQVFQHSVDDRNIVVAFCISDGKETRTIGKKIVEGLQTLHLEDLATVCVEIQKLVDDHLDYLQSFAAGLFVGNDVYLWAAKGGAVHLRRLEKHGVVLKSDELRIVSGKLQHHDLYVFGTAMFFTIIPDPCRSHLQEAEDIADDVVITVQQNHDQSQAAAYIVKCRNNEGKIAEKAFVKESVPAFTQAPQQKDSMVQSLLSRAGTFVAEKRTMIQLPQNPKKKKILVISIVAILVIAGMMIWGNIRSSQRDTRVNAALAPVHQLLDSAKTKQSTDLPTARTLAKQAIESAKEKTSMYKQKSYEWRKASALAEDAQSYYDSISGEKHVSFPVFYNLQLVKQSFIGKRMAIAGDAIVFLDPEENAAISVKIENKQSSVLNTTGVSESRAITALDKHIYILGDGVYEDGKVVIQKSDAWQDPAFINAFGSNIYVLDRGVRALSKYAGSDGTFSSNPTNWIKSAAGLDFSLVNSVAIDGKVWITTKKGEIFAFAQGTKTPFSVKNLSLQFTQPIVLYTAESLSHLYILDPANNRVVMLDKNGEYQKQWIGAEVGTATDVVVSPDEKTAFFSSGSVVYSLNLE